MISFLSNAVSDPPMRTSSFVSGFMVLLYTTRRRISTGSRVLSEGGGRKVREQLCGSGCITHLKTPAPFGAGAGFSEGSRHQSPLNSSHMACQEGMAASISSAGVPPASCQSRGWPSTLFWVPRFRQRLPSECSASRSMA